LGFLACLLAVVAAQAQTPEERTKQILDLVLQHKCDTFYALFAPEMKQAISLKEYASQVDQLLAALGTPTGRDAPSTRRVQDSVVVTIPVHWPAETLNFIVSWNKDAKVEGTWFHLPDRPDPPAYEIASYSHAAAFSTQDVTVGDDEWKLPGTLNLPTGAGPFPGIVLVQGSGPNDRDESIGGARVFRDLAEGLATRGIAVLRYDKRTLAHPRECTAMHNFTVNQETVEDAVRAAALLRRQEHVDPRRVFVLGHSLGGNMAPRIMQADPKLAGAIVLAGNVRPIEELIVEQVEYLSTAASKEQLDALKRDPWKALPGIPESYRSDLKGYNPVDLARRSQIPMLILQGERDYQVTMKDFALWKSGLAGRRDVTLRSFPALNHLFIAGEGKSTPQEYDKPAHVAPEVIDAIATWTLR